MATTKAQNRYDSPLTTVQLTDGRIVYTPSRPISITPDVNDVQITAFSDTRADIIAKNAYGSVNDWWRISQANQSVNGSLFFTPGQQISIPKKT